MVVAVVRAGRRATLEARHPTPAPYAPAPVTTGGLAATSRPSTARRSTSTPCWTRSTTSSRCVHGCAAHAGADELRWAAIARTRGVPSCVLPERPPALLRPPAPPSCPPAPPSCPRPAPRSPSARPTRPCACPSPASTRSRVLVMCWRAAWSRALSSPAMRSSSCPPTPPPTSARAR